MNANLRERIDHTFPDIIQAGAGIGHVYLKIEGELPDPETVDDCVDLSLSQEFLGNHQARLSRTVYETFHKALIGEGNNGSLVDISVWSLLAGPRMLSVSGDQVICGIMAEPYGEIFAAEYDLSKLNFCQELGAEDPRRMMPANSFRISMQPYGPL